MPLDTLELFAAPAQICGICQNNSILGRECGLQSEEQALGGSPNVTFTNLVELQQNISTWMIDHGGVLKTTNVAALLFFT